MLGPAYILTAKMARLIKIWIDVLLPDVYQSFTQVLQGMFHILNNTPPRILICPLRLHFRELLALNFTLRFAFHFLHFTLL